MVTNHNNQSASVKEYLTSLKQSRKFGPQVVYHKILDATNPHFYSNTHVLSSELHSCLKKYGIEKLYSHQGEALEGVKQGKNIMIATPTSSGKSMVYNLPVLERIRSDAPCHALYLFPLKALSQDQLRTINNLAETLFDEDEPFGKNIAAIYDGDTTP